MLSFFSSRSCSLLQFKFATKKKWRLSKSSNLQYHLTLALRLLACIHKGSGNPIAHEILDLIVVFFRSGSEIITFSPGRQEKVSLKRAILRAFHLVVRNIYYSSAVGQLGAVGIRPYYQG